MSDEEIEYLDEDADIVQQCVQLQPAYEPPAHIIPKSPSSPLLVERPTPGRSGLRSKRKKEDDTDYDPSVDNPHKGNRKRRSVQTPRPTPKPSQQPQSQPQIQTQRYVETLTPRHGRKIEFVYQKPELEDFEELNRREMTIQIPDFDDPLCLPVRAILRDENDLRKLRHWNNVCLEQFKVYDKPMRPRSGDTSSSKRTVVIRNLFNKKNGKTETTVWSKITVEDHLGDEKSDIIHSVLPRYREKKLLNIYRLTDKSAKPAKPVKHRYEVILTKEKDGQDDTLVAYKPNESLSMVFKMFHKNSDLPGGSEEDQKRYIEEMASCKMCAPCYQTSWRGVEKNIKQDISCQVCDRPCISIHNLFQHLKVHSKEDVKRSRKKISRCVAKALTYHYKCRVCQKQFFTIRDLRIHVKTHKGAGDFHCEVGDHDVVVE